jgi:glycogen operon protein
MLSQGVPMMVAGDEIGRTQHGNNNAYCQDNEISWVDWTMTPEKTQLLGFVRKLIALRRSHPTFRRRDFFAGEATHGNGLKDLVWLKPDGGEMTQTEWEQDFARCLGMYLSGAALHAVSRHGRPIFDDDFLVLFNAHHEDVEFRMPELGGEAWQTLIDTTHPSGSVEPKVLAPGDIYPLHCRSLAVFIRKAAEP